MRTESPQRISGTRDYLYKGCVLGRYESGRGGVRWMVIKDGKDLAGDYTRRYMAQNYVDIIVGRPVRCQRNTTND